MNSLTNSLKNKMCSLQNEVNLEDSEDFVIAITNNSNQIVNIHEADFYAVFVIKNYNFNKKWK